MAEGMLKHRLRSEKDARTCFRTGVRLPSPPPNKAPHYTKCGAFTMFTTLYMAYVWMTAFSGSNDKRM